MKKIGILGGTFDPVHIAHIEIAKAALEQFDLDEVRLMTGGIPPHKRDRIITPADIRFHMTELASENTNGIVADDFELSKTEYTYTAKILTELKELHPDWEIYFIIGEDSLYDFPKWYEPQIIARNCVLLVYPRNKETDIKNLANERRKQFDADIRVIDAMVFDVSSTRIRERVRDGLSIKGLVTPKVEMFINEKGLYR